MDFLDELIMSGEFLLSEIASGKLKKDICDPVLDEIVDDCNEIYHSAIKKWYGSYHPRFYIRQQYSLYSMYNVRREGFSISTDEGSQYSTGSHRAVEDVIFDNSFVHGYHGGAPFGEDEVFIPEVPNGFRARPYDGPYKRPWAKIKHPKWKLRAEQSESPLEIVNKEVEKYMEQWDYTIESRCFDGIRKYIPNFGG